MPSGTRLTDPSPLGLAVMAVLFEAPSHPYDIQRTLRERGKDEVIDFKPAGVYRMVERLVGAGLVEEVGTDREGKRPERTVYRLTDDGSVVVLQWLQEMLTKPRHEYPIFPAAVSLMPLLLPQAVRASLELRLAGLDGEIARLRAHLEHAVTREFPRLFMLEEELQLATFEAEARWVTGLVQDLAAGRLTWDHESLRQMGGLPLASPLAVYRREADMA